MYESSNAGLRAGTAGGTLLAVLANIQGGDIIKTGILSVTGAVASFFVSLLLKWMVKRCRRTRRSS